MVLGLAVLGNIPPEQWAFLAGLVTLASAAVAGFFEWSRRFRRENTEQHLDNKSLMTSMYDVQVETLRQLNEVDRKLEDHLNGHTHPRKKSA